MGRPESRAFGWVARNLIAAAMVVMCDRGASAAVSVLSDGAGGAPAAILIHSAITRGDFDRFGAAVARIRALNGNRINDVPFVTVELDSPGGDVVEAVKIGRAIYQNFMMTLVRPGRECVSACVFILVAGAVHTPADGASIGLHRPLLVSWRNISGMEARARYDALMRYLRDYFLKLGVSGAAWDIMMRTDSFGMRYFGPEELDRLGLRGEDPAWEKLYHLKWSAGRLESLPTRKSYMDLPKIAEIDEAYRYLVFMPGAYHPGTDYFAGVRVPEIHFTWQSIDDGQSTEPAAPMPDLEMLIGTIADSVTRYFRPVWVLLLVAAFEILRHRRSNRIS